MGPVTLGKARMTVRPPSTQPFTTIMRRCRYLLPTAVGVSSFAACARGHQSESTSPRGELRIIATDEGFELPDSVSGGLVHVIFENHGSTIHEVMFIKLSEGMGAEGYLSGVRSGTSFPKGALDYSGPGLTSPGGQVE